VSYLKDPATAPCGCEYGLITGLLIKECPVHAKRVRSEIIKAAGRVERLKIRLRQQGKAVEATTAELRQAKRFLSSLVEDAAPEAPTEEAPTSAQADFGVVPV